MALVKVSPVYTWDNNVKRYRRQGKFVSQDEVIKYREKYLEGETPINRQLATQLFDRQMTIGQFEEAIRDSLKRVYTVQFMLAKGGRHQMTQRDWGALGQILREQYHYLRNKFIADLVNGKYTIDQLDLVINRMGLYIQNSSQQAFERGNLERLRGTEVRLLWVRNKLLDSCKDCIRLEGQIHTANEWLSSGYWPRRNALACMGIHCGCVLVEVEVTESSGSF